MYLDARNFEEFIDADKIVYDGRGVVLHLADQMAFSGIPRFTLGAKGEAVMVGGNIGTMPLKRDPLRFMDTCVAVFKEGIKEGMPKGIRCVVVCDTRVAMFGLLFPQFLVPSGYYGAMQTIVIPTRRVEIQVGYPMARMYFVDDTVEAEKKETASNKGQSASNAGTRTRSRSTSDKGDE